jgi:hypothetical protein
MTRYTKIGRKTHLEASEFQARALIPRHKRQISDDNNNNIEYARRRMASGTNVATGKLFSANIFIAYYKY